MFKHILWSSAFREPAQLRLCLSSSPYLKPCKRRAKPAYEIESVRASEVHYVQVLCFRDGPHRSEGVQTLDNKVELKAALEGGCHKIPPHLHTGTFALSPALILAAWLQAPCARQMTITSLLSNNCQTATGSGMPTSQHSPVTALVGRAPLGGVQRPRWTCILACLQGLKGKECSKLITSLRAVQTLRPTSSKVESWTVPRTSKRHACKLPIATLWPALEYGLPDDKSTVDVHRSL